MKNLLNTTYRYFKDFQSPSSSKPSELSITDIFRNEINTMSRKFFFAFIISSFIIIFLNIIVGDLYKMTITFKNSELTLFMVSLFIIFFSFLALFFLFKINKNIKINEKKLSPRNIDIVPMELLFHFTKGFSEGFIDHEKQEI